jgi:hypothetical protein
VSSDTLHTQEGGSTTFTLQLRKQPTTDLVVTIIRSSGDATITTDVATLTFTAANWSSPQTVAVNAASDSNLVASTATFTLSAEGLASQTVTVNAADTDVQALVISQPSLLLVEGESGNVGISLAYQPSEPVIVTITRSSGDATISANKTTLSFTAANWNVAQQVSITAALDDNLTNSSAVFTISAPGAANKTVAVTAVDADATTLVVTPANLSIEEGGNGTFQVRLAYKPDANVTVSVARTSGDNTISSSVASLTFTPTNWNILQTVIVSAPSDSNQSDSSAVFTVSVPTYRSQQLSGRLAQMGRKMSLPRVMTQTVTVTASDMDILPLSTSSFSLMATSVTSLSETTDTISTAAASSSRGTVLTQQVSDVSTPSRTTATEDLIALKQASRAQASNLFTLLGNFSADDSQEDWQEAAHALAQYQPAQKATPINVPQQW